MVMDPEHPTSATAQAEAEAARATSAQVPRSRNEQMDILISSVQGMQKDIKGILDNQNSLVRIFENRIKTLNDKVDELTKTVNELKKEVDSVPLPQTSSSSDDDGSPLRPGTRFTTKARPATMPAPDLRPSSSAPATVTSAPSAPVPPIATPTPSTTSAEIFADAVLSTPSSTTGGDQPKNA